VAVRWGFSRPRRCELPRHAVTTADVRARSAPVRSVAQKRGCPAISVGGTCHVRHAAVSQITPELCGCITTPAARLDDMAARKSRGFVLSKLCIHYLLRCFSWNHFVCPRPRSHYQLLLTLSHSSPVQDLFMTDRSFLQKRQDSRSVTKSHTFLSYTSLGHITIASGHRRFNII